MELHRVRCTQYGADFDQYDPSARFMKCTRMGCGAVFVVEQGVNFASVQAQKAEEIGNLRHALENAVQSRNNEMIYRYAADIQALLPDDFIANFWIALLSVRLYDKHPKLYKEFLRSERSASPEEALKCADFAIDNAEERFHKDIRAFLDAHLSQEDAKKRKDTLKKHLIRLRELEKRSGEIFILTDDDGGEFADCLYDSLKKRRADCWCERKNLSVDTTGYTARIREAAEECRVMVIVATGALVRNASAKNLISARVKDGIPLIVIKADDMPFTTTFTKLIGSAPVFDRNDRELYGKVFASAQEALNPETAEEDANTESGENTEEILPETKKPEIPVFDDFPKIDPPSRILTLDDLDLSFDTGESDLFDLPGIEEAGALSDEDPLSPPRFSGFGYVDPLRTDPIEADENVRKMLYKSLDEVKNMKPEDDFLSPPSLLDEEEDPEPPMLIF